jgi:hypothetical protein
MRSHGGTQRIAAEGVSVEKGAIGVSEKAFEDALRRQRAGHG